MHKVAVPKKSGIHRFACLALYRALLRQCSASAGDAPWRDETKVLVTNRFRKYKGLESPSQVSNALKAGYKTLDLLDSATKGNQEGVSQVSTIIAQAKLASEKRAARQKEKSEAKPGTALSLSPRKARKMEMIRFQEETRKKHPDAVSILARPFQKVSGKRRVPVLVNARGVPFLRIKKPQPSNLSGFLRAKLKKRWSFIENRERLNIEHLFARDEDEWDRLTRIREPCKWTEEVTSALGDVSAKITKFDTANKVMAAKMWQIVLKERALAAKEESEAQKVE